jgi:hypothetical protein
MFPLAVLVGLWRGSIIRFNCEGELGGTNPHEVEEEDEELMLFV